MATIGITSSSSASARLIFGGDVQADDHDIWHLPPAASLEIFGGVSRPAVDLAAAVVAGVAGRGACVFFQKTAHRPRPARGRRQTTRRRFGRHLAATDLGDRLVRRRHRRRSSTGIMWGARSDVSFALQSSPYKALPVLILGGFTSMPGAIVGGLIIGVGEKVVEIYWGPAARRRHRELVRLRARAGLPAVPAAGPVRRKDHRAGVRRMLYREAGQFKTSYAADMAIFPDPRRTAIVLGVILLVAFVGRAATRQRIRLLTHHDPSSSMRWRRSGSTSSPAMPGSFRSAPAPSWRSAPIACYKLTTAFPGLNIVVGDPPRPGFVAAAVGVLFGLPSLRIKGFYLAVATLAAQFFLSGCSSGPGSTTTASSGAIQAPHATMFGIPSPARRRLADAISMSCSPSSS